MTNNYYGFQQNKQLLWLIINTCTYVFVSCQIVMWYRQHVNKIHHYTSCDQMSEQH